jgi:hypothetical protein
MRQKTEIWPAPLSRVQRRSKGAGGVAPLIEMALPKEQRRNRRALACSIVRAIGAHGRSDAGRRRKNRSQPIPSNAHSTDAARRSKSGRARHQPPLPASRQAGLRGKRAGAACAIWRLLPTSEPGKAASDPPTRPARLASARIRPRRRRRSKPHDRLAPDHHRADASRPDRSGASTGGLHHADAFPPTRNVQRFRIRAGFE